MTAVVRLAGDGGRAKAVAAAVKMAAARQAAPKTAKSAPKRLAFADLLALSKAKNSSSDR